MLSCGMSTISCPGRWIAAGVVAISLGLAAARAQGTYTYTQPGWIFGGQVSGNFTGTDQNSDGKLTLGEITSLSLTFTNVTNMQNNLTFTQADLLTFSYVTGATAFSGQGNYLSVTQGNYSYRVNEGSGQGYIPAVGGVHGDNLTNVVATVGVSAVPEPSTYAAIAGGAVFGVVGWMKRRRRSASPAN